MILPRAVDGGILRGPLPEDSVRTSILVTMFTIAIYQCLIIYIQIFATFKRRNTLYFWSLLIAATGIISHSLGVILKWFSATCPWYVNTMFASFGWWGMVTGQSLVLYSRLHLVVRDERVLRFVLIMVVTDFLVFQVPTTILTFGSNQVEPGMWLKVYNVYERIQLIIFTLQELVISIIYIRAAVKMLKPSDPDDTRHTKKFLIYLNVLCIVLDIAFVAEVYSGEWVYKTGTQSLAYGVKLTVEFVVLNKLMSVARSGVGGSMGRGGYGSGARDGSHDEEDDMSNANLNSGRKWSSAAVFSPSKWERRRSGGAQAPPPLATDSNSRATFRSGPQARAYAHAHANSPSQKHGRPQARNASIASEMTRFTPPRPSTGSEHSVCDPHKPLPVPAETSFILSPAEANPGQSRGWSNSTRSSKGTDMTAVESPAPFAMGKR